MRTDVVRKTRNPTRGYKPFYAPRKRLTSVLGKTSIVQYYHRNHNISRNTAALTMLQQLNSNPTNRKGSKMTGWTELKVLQKSISDLEKVVEVSKI